MAPEKDNSFKPNLTPRLNSVENIAPSGEFLQPVADRAEVVPSKETQNFIESEHPVVNQEIFTENKQNITNISPVVTRNTLANPMSVYEGLIQSDQSPHKLVDSLNQIRKSA